MTISWGLKRLLASPATDLLVGIFLHIFFSSCWDENVSLMSNLPVKNRRKSNKNLLVSAGVGRLAGASYSLSPSPNLPRSFSPCSQTLHPSTFYCPALRSYWKSSWHRCQIPQPILIYVVICVLSQACSQILTPPASLPHLTQTLHLGRPYCKHFWIQRSNIVPLIFLFYFSLFRCASI